MVVVSRVFGEEQKFCVIGQEDHADSSFIAMPSIEKIFRRPSNQVDCDARKCCQTNYENFWLSGGKGDCTV